MKRPKIRNVIRNDGLTQQDRFLSELDPLYAKIDERSLTDLLAFAWQYSAHLRFFEAAETGQGVTVRENGSWQQLLRHDELFCLATISVFSMDKFSREFEDALSKMNDDALSDDEWDATIYPAFVTVVGLCRQADEWSRLLPIGSKSAKDIKIYIGQLKVKIEKLLALYRLKIDDDRLWEHVTVVLKSWDIARFGAPVPGGALLSNDHIERALRDLFGEVQTICAALINNAKQMLEALLTDDSHQAHTGLFLAFLHLLENNREHLNTLSGRHLDFYLRDILKLTPKERIPDAVNVTFELKKTVDRHRLPAGTAFKAGKNQDKIERVYDLKHEVSLNKAVVADLKNIHVVRVSEFSRSVHSSAVANSADGMGMALAEENPKWPGFGRLSYPMARLGFALSSPFFRLAEGHRQVILEIGLVDLTPFETVYADEFAAADIGDDVLLPEFFIASISTAKGAYECRPNIALKREIKTLTLEFDFDIGFAPIVDYDAEKMADPVVLPFKWPVFQFIVDQDGCPDAYGILCSMQARDINVRITVDHIRQLVLESDAAKLKADKPFLPFGNQPRKGSSFYIGHAEAFAKPLTGLTLSWNWVDAPSNLGDHYENYTDSDFRFKIDADLRENYTWDHSLGTDIELSDMSPEHKLKDGLAPFSVTGYTGVFEAESFTQFSEAMRQGGIRMKLMAPEFAFGHKMYPKLHSEAVTAALRSTNPDPSLLETLQLPYTPMMENFELAYTAEKKFSLTATEANLDICMLHPFGYTRPGGGMLIADYGSEGALLIGITGLVPPQNLSLLIQLAEGSGDPFKSAPREVVWSYLTAAGWVAFKSAEILRDATLGFLQSGIIEFSLPQSMSDSKSEMPGGLHWLRVTVSDNTAALHDVLAIISQAGVAVYRDEGHRAEHLATALPPGSVTKLQTRDITIKSVSQPFASYGGRETETDAEFYARCSERLRHKDRCVGLWDYEHLILERFPEIHKVKCLNHTCLASDYSPGNVMLVLVPDLRNRNSRYPLRPAVAQSVLDEVKRFVAARCSAHVEVHVVNPFYERIAVGGTAHFHRGYDQGIYQTQLHQDITNGLTPWLRGEKDLHFGGRIHSSVLLNLIEKLPYIDYISDFSVTHYSGPNDVEGKQVDEVIATSNRSVLVSNGSHTIQGISPS